MAKKTNSSTTGSPLKIKRRYTRVAPGSVLIQAGGTTVLCTASIADEVPPWSFSVQHAQVDEEAGNSNLGMHFIPE